MKRDKKKFWLDLLGKDEREIRKIERARKRRDARFFDDWFDKYNKPIRRHEQLVKDIKRRKDDWL